MALWLNGKHGIIPLPVSGFESHWCQSSRCLDAFLCPSYMALWLNGNRDLIAVLVSGFESHWCLYWQTMPLFMKRTSSDIQTWPSVWWTLLPHAMMVYWVQSSDLILMRWFDSSGGDIQDAKVMFWYCLDYTIYIIELTDWCNTPTHYTAQPKDRQIQ